MATRRARRARKKAAAEATPAAPTPAAMEWDVAAAPVATKASRRARRRRKKEKGGAAETEPGPAAGGDGDARLRLDQANGDAVPGASDATTVSEVLHSLDPDILNYVRGILESVDFDDDEGAFAGAVQDAVGQVLVSSEFCAEGQELSVVCTSLARIQHKAHRESLSSANGNATTATRAYDNVAQASTKRSGRGLTAQQKRIRRQEAAEREAERIAAKQAAALQAKLDKQAAKKKKRRAGAAEEAAREREQINAELEAARVAAVQARVRLGTFKGHLSVSDFTLQNPGGGQPLLEDVSCILVPGRRYGLIGRNGTGKSTMLRALGSRRAGELPENLLVHYVSQEVNLSPTQRVKTPVELVVDADIERRLLIQEAGELENAMAAAAANNGSEVADDAVETGAKDAARLGDVLSRLIEIESDTAEVRATELLDNLGFGALKHRALEDLSGGWRVRTMLAAAIFAKPDLLLLDEPTNHLSILAVMWLARELRESETWKDRVVVVVSHDRQFMDEVCSDILHISGAARQLTQHRGNYSQWSQVRAEKKAEFAREVALRQAEIDKLREYAGHGFRYGGSSSQINKMKMKDKQAAKLEEEMVVHKLNLASLKEDLELPLKISSGGEVDGFLVRMKNVSFGYGQTSGSVDMLFEECDIALTSKSRVVLLGENGAGKTTLVKLLTGTLAPVKGEVIRSPHCRFAIVNQHHADRSTCRSPHCNSC